MKFLRDPIAQFVLIGLFLVVLNHVWTSWQGAQGRTISVSTAEIERLEKLWANTAGRLPTGEDRAQIIAQFVQEEVLVREAERLGLGDNDTIIRRRLAQKMDFLAGDESLPDDPSDAVLEAWFEDNRQQFAAPELRSFIHVYFSPEKHGPAINIVAEQALQQLQSGGEWKRTGDPYIQKRSYAALPKAEVQRLFGPDFAESLFALSPGQWSKPIGSAFGLHLVRIETVDNSAQADFEPVKADVLAAWREEKRSDAKQAALDKLVQGYDVVIEDEQ